MIKLVTMEWGCTFYPNWIKLNFDLEFAINCLSARQRMTYISLLLALKLHSRLNDRKVRNNARHSTVDTQCQHFVVKLPFKCKMTAWSGNQSILVVVISIWKFIHFVSEPPFIECPNVWFIHSGVYSNRLHKKKNKNSPRRIIYELFDGLKLSNDHKEICRSRQADIFVLVEMTRAQSTCDVLLVARSWNDKRPTETKRNAKIFYDDK